MERLYRWPDNITFNDITLMDLRHSMALADALKKLN